MSAEESIGHLSVPIEFLKKLAAIARESGDPALLASVLDEIPEVARFAPTVDLEQPLQSLARELGRLCRNSRTPAGLHLFVRDGAVVSVNENTGETSSMTAGRFVSWIESHCAFKPSPRRVRPSLGVDEARSVLSSDAFVSELRPLRAVHTMRLPVLRAGVNVGFLPPGYDAPTGIFTCDLLKYEMDWTVDQAREWILDVCGELPWNSEDEGGDLAKNRSLAVHVALLVGNYCCALFPESTLRPMVAYFANKPGTGKTRAAEMALAHVHGFIGGATAPRDEEKMDVKLETIARGRRPYVLFDDVGGALRSNALNKFLTEARHTGRCYHSNSEFFDVPNVTQVIVTANDLQTSEDLSRRALIAELFLAEDVRGRKFRRTLTPGWLADPRTRASFLSACCAIVKHWAASETDSGGLPRHTAPLETFEEWTGAIGAMVIMAGFADPLERPKTYVACGDENDELRRLLIIVASQHEEDCEIDRKDLVRFARANGLIERIVGTLGDPDLDGSANRTLGRRLERWRGQHLATAGGRRFTFGHKHKKTGAVYPLQFLAPAQAAD